MAAAKQRRPRKQKRRQRNTQVKANKPPTRKDKRPFIEEPRPSNELRFLTKQEVMAKVRLTYPSIWKKMRNDTFPRAHEMGPDKKIVWFAHEIEAWMFGLPIRKYLGDEEKEAEAA